MVNCKIHSEIRSASCYFRTITEPPYRKALVQITERCNLRCEHCFVSSSNIGDEMSFELFKSNVLPMLIKAMVRKVTITGGEPLVHKSLMDIVKLLRIEDITVSICTNATLLTEEFILATSKIGGIHFNVSLDGFSERSHGKFRGNENATIFKRTYDNIILLSKYRLLNGILVTPNEYSGIDEYIKICQFAKEQGARYVLMNPLSEFGRGQDSVNVAYTEMKMHKLRVATKAFDDSNFEVLYIRFPNEEKPLESCAAGRLFYVFSSGAVAICPYMVFASKNRVSIYDSEEFILGNLKDKTFDLAKSLDEYRIPDSIIPSKCTIEGCYGGCPAAKIAKGLRITDCDRDLCPIE